MQLNTLTIAEGALELKETNRLVKVWIISAQVRVPLDGRQVEFSAEGGRLRLERLLLQLVVVVKVDLVLVRVRLRRFHRRLGWVQTRELAVALEVGPAVGAHQNLFFACNLKNGDFISSINLRSLLFATEQCSKLIK